MDIALTLGLVLFVVHIVAFVAGGANSVVMPILGTKMATATPQMRAEYMDVAHRVAKVGKWAMVTLLVTGVLVLWLKWNFAVPNAWFWVKMAELRPCGTAFCSFAWVRRADSAVSIGMFSSTFLPPA